MPDFIRRVDRLERALPSRLGRLDIELTERCNNDCLHCCVNLPEADREALSREMTTEQVKAIMEDAASLGCLQVRLTGGEPLLRRDFVELYLHARRLGMRVLIFTNARLVDPELAELFARVPPLVAIEVTVYGMSEESCASSTRSPEGYGQFKRGVDLLLSHGVPFIVKAACLPAFKAEIDEFEAWAATIPRMGIRPGYSMFFDLRSRRDSESKNRLIRSLRLGAEEGLAILAREPEKFRKEMAEFGSRFMGPPGDSLFRCGAGHGASVDAYGVAQPCMGLRAPELCFDLLGGEIDAVPVRSRRAPATLGLALDRFASLALMRSANPDYLARCARCFLKGLCEQCPAKSWTETGTLDAPQEYLCGIAHAQARWLGWLAPGENAWDVGEWRERLRREEPAR